MITLKNWCRAVQTVLMQDIKDFLISSMNVLLLLWRIMVFQMHGKHSTPVSFFFIWRDLHCYCVQVNSSDYGDSRITMPSRTEVKDILKTKGGNNDTVLVGTIDVEKLREP